MAECRPKNYPKLKDYKPSRFMLPICHYDAAKADRAVTFIENLRHTKGKWAGKRFWLLPWQEQIIRDVFGIVDEKETVSSARLMSKSVRRTASPNLPLPWPCICFLPIMSHLPKSMVLQLTASRHPSSLMLPTRWCR